MNSLQILNFITLILILWGASFGLTLFMARKAWSKGLFMSGLDRIGPHIAMVAVTLLAGLSTIPIWSQGETPSLKQTTTDSKVPALEFSAKITEGQWDQVPILNHLRRSGLGLTFLGMDAGGLPAFLGSDGADKQAIYYITPDGEHAIAGLAFDAQGEVITATQLSRIADKINPTAGVQNSSASTIDAGPTDKANRLWSQLEQTHWIALGNLEKPPLYMIADPACPYCARAWEALKGPLERGEIQVRVIPVSLINGSNPAIVHEIFSSEHPDKAWKDAIEAKINGQRAKRYAGSPPSKLQNMLDQNHLFFADWQLKQVPQFYFLDDEEDALTLNSHIGMIEKEMMAKITAQ